MNRNGFISTISKIKWILVQSSNNTVQKFGFLSEIVDENHITSHLIYDMKELILKNLEGLKQSVCEDLMSSLQCLRGYSTEVEAYVDQNLIIHVELHNPRFEGKISGSDFGLIFHRPEIQVSYLGIEIVPGYNGLLIQAKRNAVDIKKPEEYRKLKNPNFPFKNIREFFSLALYRFEEFRLSNILFTPLDAIEGDDSHFFQEVNDILSGKKEWVFLNAEEFFSKFLYCEIGTRDLSEIEKFILTREVPYFQFIIEFRDDGDGLKRIVEELEEQLIRKKQTKERAIRERV